MNFLNFILYFFCCLSGVPENQHLTKKLPLQPPTYDFENPRKAIAGLNLETYTRFQANAPARPAPLFSISGAWEYEAGRESENLKSFAIPDFKNAEQVNLPHRILLPNHSMWYRSPIRTEAPFIIHAAADDGAQVFLDDEQLAQCAPGGFFEINTHSKNRRLVVRVLNNAMKGGLNKVDVFDKNDFEQYRDAVKQAEQQSVFFKKLAHLKKLPAGFENASGIDALKNQLEALPYFLAGPVTDFCGADSVRIFLETTHDAPVRLYFQKAGAQTLDSLTQIPQNGVVRFYLSQLKRGENYTYQVNQLDAWSEVFHFNLPAEVPENVEFTIWADSQNGLDTFQKITTLPEFLSADFTIGVGDLVGYGARAAQWWDFFEALRPPSRKMPVWLVGGNHDYDGYYDDLQAANFQKYRHTKPYFMKSYGRICFIGLDPNTTFPVGFEKAQKAFFYRAVESAAWKNADWRFVLMHQPPFSQGWEGYAGEACVRELLEPVMESAKIDFVVSGHTHDYERLEKMYGSQKTTFLIVGGAGGGLETPPLPPPADAFSKMDTVIMRHHFGKFSASPKKISFRAYDTQGRVLDVVERWR